MQTFRGVCGASSENALDLKTQSLDQLESTRDNVIRECVPNDL